MTLGGEPSSEAEKDLQRQTQEIQQTCSLFLREGRRYREDAVAKL